MRLPLVSNAFSADVGKHTTALSVTRIMDAQHGHTVWVARMGRSARAHSTVTRYGRTA